jgi:hypothetical protein
MLEFRDEDRVGDAEIVSVEVVESEEELSPNERIARSRWQVLVLLFCAAGPLALPVLIASPRFSRGWKVVLFLLVVVQTVLVVVILVVFVEWFLGQVALMRQMM